MKDADCLRGKMILMAPVQKTLYNLFKNYRTIVIKRVFSQVSSNPCQVQHIHLPHNLIVDGTVKSKIGFKKLRAVSLNACFDEFINMALVYLPEMAT